MIVDILLFGIAGDGADPCGTKWPGWWRKGPFPPPPPWWWLADLVSIAGGIFGGTLTQRIIGGNPHDGVTMIASLGVAYLTGKVAGTFAARAIDAAATSRQAVAAKAIA